MQRFRPQSPPPPYFGLRPKSLHALWLVPVLALSAFAADHYPLKYRIDSVLGGPTSPYTPLIVELIRSWPPKDIDYSERLTQPVMVRALETPGNRFYIGAEQWMRIHAPLARVEAVLDSFGEYQEIFPDYKDIHVVSTDGNQVVTFWEQKVPFFLAPNVKYRMTYLIDQSSPTRNIYRYKLESSKDLKFDDGVIVIEAEGSDSTRYTEYDFFDANWGIAKTLAPERIWKDSIGGLYVSDVAVLLKAEHPDWKNSKVLDEAKNALDRYPIEDVLKKKKTFSLLK